MAQSVVTGDSAARIAQSVELAVHKGHLKPGDLLPTVRELATSLKVSPTTVAAAYKVLQWRGLVSGSGRLGTRVSRPRTPAASATSLVPDGVADLATGNPDPDLLPSLDEALRSIDPAPRLYDGPAILQGLATFIAGEFEADSIPAASLTIASGGLDAIERVLREHVRAGDRVAVEDPAFPGVLDLLAANGFVAVPVAIDDDGPLPVAFHGAAGRVRAAIVTPRAQNPTGACLSAARVAELRRILKRVPDLLVIEDDHAGPIAGAPARTLCDAGRERWAVVRSVSKFLGPDLRTAFVAGDVMTIARVEGRQALGARWVSRLLQQLVLSLWSDPSSARRLARAADVYQERREALRASLIQRGIVSTGQSGFHVWVPTREESHVVQALLDKGWAVAPGERFRLKTPPAIRVTTATLTPDHATRFADDLAAVTGTTRVRTLA